MFLTQIKKGKKSIFKMEKQNRYSIRKLTVGAASVLIGVSLFGIQSQVAHADTVNDTQAVANQTGSDNSQQKLLDTAEKSSQLQDKVDKMENASLWQRITRKFE